MCYSHCQRTLSTNQPRVKMPKVYITFFSPNVNTLCWTLYLLVDDIWWTNCGSHYISLYWYNYFFNYTNDCCTFAGDIVRLIEGYDREVLRRWSRKPLPLFDYIHNKLEGDNFMDSDDSSKGASGGWDSTTDRPIKCKGSPDYKADTPWAICRLQRRCLKIFFPFCHTVTCRLLRVRHTVRSAGTRCWHAWRTKTLTAQRQA
jgi:hypothetical protein